MEINTSGFGKVSKYQEKRYLKQKEMLERFYNAEHKMIQTRHSTGEKKEGK